MQVDRPSSKQPQLSETASAVQTAESQPLALTIAKVVFVAAAIIAVVALAAAGGLFVAAGFVVTTAVATFLGISLAAFAIAAVASYLARAKQSHQIEQLESKVSQLQSAKVPATPAVKVDPTDLKNPPVVDPKRLSTHNSSTQIPSVPLVDLVSGNTSIEDPSVAKIDLGTASNPPDVGAVKVVTSDPAIQENPPVGVTGSKVPDTNTEIVVPQPPKPPLSVPPPPPPPPPPPLSVNPGSSTNPPKPPASVRHSITPDQVAAAQAQILNNNKNPVAKQQLDETLRLAQAALAVQVDLDGGEIESDDDW